MAGQITKADSWFIGDRVTKELKGVRYISIDTPETGKAFGLEAWQANREMVEGKVVYLERDVSEKDKYGRLLRLCLC